MTSLQNSEYETLFKKHRNFLWGLSYRMTGHAQDADDLVQETFIRAMHKPPSDRQKPLRPWLVKVCINLGKDLLRKRKRQSYSGTWLPAPVEAQQLIPLEEPGIESTYTFWESVSFAFLFALEALTPQQRAVLLLRDVFDYSVRETSYALGIKESNVKTTHHRARKTLEPSHKERPTPNPKTQEQTKQMLKKLMEALLQQDVSAIETLLVKSARLYSDGGGEFLAARVPILGSQKITRFLLKLSARRSTPERIEIRTINAMPALLIDMGSMLQSGSKLEAQRFIFRCDLSKEENKIQAIHSVLASKKLTAIQF